MRAYPLILLFLLVSRTANSECTESKPNKPAVKKATPAWLKYCNERSKQYKIHPAGDANQSFRRLPQPVMLHTQPVRGDQLGAVYLWITKSGKPVAVGTTILAPETWLPGDTHYVIEEFHSLHDGAIKGELAGRIWNSPGPGLQWDKLENIENPKGKFVVLTSQARRIAKGFDARAIDHRAEDQIRPLRMQPNPVYKYQLAKDPNKASAGFIFAGCLGTDPEVFLCLEVRQTAAGNRWYLAFAAFSDMRVVVDRKGKEVWEGKRSWGREHIGSQTVTGLTLPK